MGLIRVHKTKDYTVMSNCHLREKNMSLKAKGLLSQMLSLPENWDYSIAGLVAINKESKDLIKATLDELKSFGYLKVTKLMPDKTPNGRISYEYDIYEVPYKKQGGEKQGLVFQALEKQGVEKPTQYNTKESITKKSITKDKNNVYLNQLEKEFETIWKAYPNKQGKTNALNSYKIARTKDKVEYDDVVNGLKRYLVYCKQNKDWYSPKNGSTWFKQQSWNDEYPVKEITTNDLNIDISDF